MYLILDEMILGGELAESSKKARRAGRIHQPWLQGRAGVLRCKTTGAAGALKCRLTTPPPQVILERLAELETIDT